MGPLEDHAEQALEDCQDAAAAIQGAVCGATETGLAPGSQSAADNARAQRRQKPASPPPERHLTDTEKSLLKWVLSMAFPMTANQEAEIDKVLDKLVLHDFARQHWDMDALDGLIAKIAIEGGGAGAITLGPDSIVFRPLPQAVIGNLPLLAHEACHALRMQLKGSFRWKEDYIAEWWGGTKYWNLSEEVLAREVEARMLGLLMSLGTAMSPAFALPHVF